MEATLPSQSKIREKAQTPHFLFSLLCFLFLFSSMASSELPKYIYFESYPVFSFSLLSLCAAINLALGLTIISMGKHFYGGKRNLLILIPLSIILFGEWISLLSLPNTVIVPFVQAWVGEPAVYTFSDLDRFSFFLSSFSTLFSLYVLFAYVPLVKKNRGGFYLVYELMVVFALISIIYSYITEPKAYEAIFKEGHLFDGWLAPVSFGGQKNVFGRFIMVGLFAELYLLYLDRRYYRYLMVGYLSFSLLLTAAKTPIVLSILVVLLFLLFMGISLWKEKRVIACIHLGVFLLGALSIVAVLVLPSGINEMVDKFAELIRHNLADKGGTLDTRVQIWERCLSLWRDSTFHKIFGYGSYSYSILIRTAMDYGGAVIGVSHNVWVEMLGRGGLMRLIPSIFLVGAFAYLAVLRIKEGRKDVYPSLIFLLAMFLHSTVEVSWMMDLMSESVCLSLLIVIPVLSKHGDEGRTALGEKLDKKKLGICLRDVLAIVAPTLIALGAALISGLGWIFLVLGILLEGFALAMPLLIEKEGSVISRLDPSRIALAVILTAIALLLGFLYPKVGVFDTVAITAVTFILGLIALSLMMIKEKEPRLSPLEDLASSVSYYLMRR